MTIYNIILAGGVGSRLAPLSTPEKPKQFSVKIEGKTLYQHTFDRVKAKNKTTIAFIQEQHMKFISCSNILQPEMKETAPAILKCCLELLECDASEEDVICFFPSDHIIKSESFTKDVNNVILNSVIDDCIWLFGIKPSEPNTGYGYIKVERESNLALDFREKPTEQLAIDLIKDGYVWNSGIFCGKIGVFVNLIKTHCFDLYHEQLSDKYSSQSLSFDREVLQKAKDSVKCQVVDWYWNDVGTWDKLAKEIEGNIIQVSKTLDIGEDVVDLILIENDEKIYVRNKSSTYQRPWGSYEILKDTENYKMKKLSILPGQAISLQSHNLRNEHWIVLNGTATVYLQEDIIQLKKDQSIYIPSTSKHKLENRTDEVVEIIEVQTGTYFGEDDIHRYSDNYGRI